MGYCFTCGTTADDLDATAMCAACRAAWRPSAPAAADLGCHGQPQPLPSIRHARGASATTIVPVATR